MGGEYDKDVYAFKAKYNDDFYTGSIIRMLEALSQAMAQAKSTDPVKVALRDGRPEVEERIRRRGRDAQDRPPAAAAALHDGLAEDRREAPVQPREHRHDVRAGRRVPELRLEHADQLPDEAAAAS